MGKTNLKQEDVIRQFKEIHGDQYSYDKVKYKHDITKIIITCKIHGDFKLTPKSHKSGKGCPRCFKTGRASKNEIIDAFRAIHGDTYDYDKVNYVNDLKPITITCREHGDFIQTPKSHKQGSGCPRCNPSGRKTTEEAIQDFKTIHFDRYNYDKVDYIDSHTKVIITCKIHGDFEQTPHNHLNGNRRGSGCPSCVSNGFNSMLPGILYYLKIDNGRAYKIGITNKNVEERFTTKELERIEILKTWEYPKGKDALEKETIIMRDFKYAKWKGEDLLIYGNSELFDRDILGFDVL